MAKDNFPAHVDDTNFRMASGSLGPQRQTVYEGAIGGTHHVSTPIDPEMALTGGYQAIDGDRMPPCPGTPYLPKN